jgi:hypothetical protein
MKKRIIALALGLLISANLLSPTMASAASVPVPTSKTITLSSEEMALGTELKDQNVKVEVTYTGWLGEIDAAQNGVESGAINGKIAVLKEGSEIRFKITATDPAAYYNFCYEKTRFDDEDNPYGWDDSGSGWYYYNADMMNVMTYGQGDGTTKFAAGPLFRPELQEFGRKINANTYAYQAVNGLMQYRFTAKYVPENNTYVPYGGVAEYLLGTALTINDEQIQELAETGTMTFLKGVMLDGTESVEFQRQYQGLPELLGIAVEEKPLEYVIENYDFHNTGSDEYILDTGVSYKVTVKNTTNAPIHQYYALISYNPSASDSFGFTGQIHYFQIDLEPGESKAYPFVSYFRGLAGGTYQFVWVKFDSLSEKEAFDQTVPHGEDSENRLLSPTESIQWMKDTFGIEIPVK